jgi:hypothetical protein
MEFYKVESITRQLTISCSNVFASEHNVALQICFSASHPEEKAQLLGSGVHALEREETPDRPAR